jgi:hypothetical protein
MEEIKFNVNGVEVSMGKEDVSKAIETGTVEIKSEELVAYKKDEFDTFKTNLANEEYKKGRTAGEEMPIKAAREELGLEFEGKTMNNLLDAFKEKVISDAKIEPTKKIQELETEKKTLQDNFTNLQGEYDTFKTTVTEKENKFKKDNAILSYMPENMLVDKDIALTVLRQKAGLDISFDESGKKLLTINGEVKKDELLNPVELSQDHITEHLKTFGLLPKKEGGNGGTDEPGGGNASSYDKFVKEMETAGSPQGSEKFQLEMNKRIKEGSLKI